MDAIFNDALERAIELDDKVVLAYFEREFDRDRRRAEGGRRGGRPKKTYGFDKKRKEAKEKNILHTHSARARGRNANVFISDAAFEELRAGWGDAVLDCVLDQLSDKLAEGYNSRNHAVTLNRFCEQQALYDMERERKRPANRVVVVNNNYPDKRKDWHNDFIKHKKGERGYNGETFTKTADQFDF